MLNHWAVVGLSSFEATPATPFGRSWPTLVLAWLFPTSSITGKPLDVETILLSCQPPRIALAMPWLRNRLPFPTGTSYNADPTKRCRVSKSEGPYSQVAHQPFAACLTESPFWGLIPLPASRDFENV